MSVIRGHKILHIKPISADKETAHAVLYMHVDEPYDPPTFVNAALYQCSNRPNAHTPMLHLPCSACLAGKLRKNRAQPENNYTDIENLTVGLKNLPLSWTASTANKDVTPNRKVSVDWRIINKKHQSGKNNVFALFLDINTGVTFIFPAESRGQAGVALQANIQKYGMPNEVVHDNANEFIQGDFAQLCLDKETTQTLSPPLRP